MSDPEGPGPPAAVARPVLPRAVTILLILSGATIAAFGIAAIKGIFAPVFLAFVLTLCVHPLRRWLQHRGLPRGVATGATIVAVFVLLAGFAAVLVAALAQFSALLPQYAAQLSQIGTFLAQSLEAVGFSPQQTQTVLEGLTPSRIISFLGSLLGSVTDIVAVLVIILTMLILLAVDGSRLPAVMTHLSSHRPALVTAFGAFGTSVRRYMVATTVLGAAQGLFNWIILVILQVPGALLWGLLSFICSFIPNIGYFIAIVPPLVFGFLSGGWSTAVAVLVIYGVINSVVQSIIQPKYIGNVVALSESLTFFSVLFWAVVLGPVGAVLAVPLTLLARTLLLDSDPAMALWRPMTGNQDELRPLLQQEDEAIRAHRKRRAAPGSPPGPPTGPPTGSPTVPPDGGTPTA